ncbi:DUF537-domain-containing protein [Trametes sanguinea]|nr:DUF537-domain-containing protein [Trametes sanguinea]
MTVNESLHEHVAIFWDYENCTPPCNVPGYDVVNNIRQVAHEYGSVKLFKAYLELSEQSSSKSIGLRSELQSCGVSLTDCPHNGRKDVADKMMIVDMLTYAIDNPAPATIILISGDRDFVYAVSVLRLRRYRVVVVAPFTAHDSLKSQATVVLDWQADIMRKTTTRSQAPEAHQALADDAQQRSPRRPPLTTGAALPQATPRSNRRASLRVPASAPMAGADGGSASTPGMPLQGRHARSQSAFTAESAARLGVTIRPESVAGFARPSTVASFVRDQDEDEEMIEDSEPILDLGDVIQNLQEERSRSSRPESRLELPAGNESTSSQMMSVNGPRLSGLLDPFSMPSNAPAIGGIAREPSDGTEEHGLSPPAATHALGSPFKPAAPANVGYIPRPATVGPLSRVPPSDPSPPSGPSLSLTDFDDSPPSFSVALGQQGAPNTSEPIQSPSRSQPVASSLNGAVSEVEPTIPPAPVPTTAASPPQKKLESASADPTTRASKPTSGVPHETPTILPVPDKFRPLVEVLEGLSRSGVYIPLRGTVGQMLVKKDQKIYAQAGAASFKDYSTAAERAGVVILGGYQGYAWIKLAPAYGGKADVPSSPAC